MTGGPRVDQAIAALDDTIDTFDKLRVATTRPPRALLARIRELRLLKARLLESSIDRDGARYAEVTAAAGRARDRAQEAVDGLLALEKALDQAAEALAAITKILDALG